MDGLYKNGTIIGQDVEGTCADKAIEVFAVNGKRLGYFLFCKRHARLEAVACADQSIDVGKIGKTLAALIRAVDQLALGNHP